MCAKAAARLAFQGSGRPRRASSCRPPGAKRSDIGQGLPKAMSAAWMRFLNMTRWRTRWRRYRACSRSARTAGSGSQMAGTQLPAAELGQHPGVDPVGLARQRGEAFHLDRVGDLHVPAVQFQRVVDETGAVHRFDGRQHRPAPEALDLPGEMGEAVAVRRGGRDCECLADVVEDVDVQPPSAEIESNVHHGVGASFRCGSGENPSSHRRRPRHHDARRIRSRRKGRWTSTSSTTSARHSAARPPRRTATASPRTSPGRSSASGAGQAAMK